MAGLNSFRQAPKYAREMLVVCLIVIVALIALFAWQYVKYSKEVDKSSSLTTQVSNLESFASGLRAEADRYPANDCHIYVDRSLVKDLELTKAEVSLICSYFNTSKIPGKTYLTFHNRQSTALQGFVGSFNDTNNLIGGPFVVKVSSDGKVTDVHTRHDAASCDAVDGKGVEKLITQCIDKDNKVRSTQP